MRLKLISILLLCTAGTVNAAPVDWTLNLTTFQDSPTADAQVAGGTFTFDSATGVYSNIDIVVCLAGCRISYDLDTQVGFATDAGHVGFSTTAPGVFLGLVFESELTEAGGNINLVFNPDDWEASLLGECSSTPACPGPNPDPSTFSSAISGSVSAVPIPAAVWLFGSGLAGLGWMRRKKS
jgi:hypothetical protein